MKTLLISTIFLITGCCTPQIKTVYVDRVVEISKCPIIEPLELNRPRLELFTGGMCTLENMGKLTTGNLKIMSYAESLELELQRYIRTINQCRKGEKR